MRPVARLLLPALLGLTGLAPASGIAQSNTILVLDGSGSMWGQIDGVAKITIARDVVTELLTSLPEDTRLGLTAYGHNRRGDCADIETLVAPGAGNRAAIADAVAGISPRGKTPMTDAVIAAAEALRYTEEKATVILVSDGIETCNPDPCAAARALEQAGVDFTVHVVGFDVTEDEALRQMQCIAEETGGIFRTVANAAELTQALVAVAEPVAASVGFRATLGEGGAEVAELLIWDVFQGDSAVAGPLQGATVTAELAPGDYRAAVLRPSDEAFAEAGFTVAGDMTVTLVLPAPKPPATVSGPDAAVAGATVPVEWEGPDADGDYITVALPDDRGYVNYTYTRDGSPLELLMPPEPGDYELRYVLADGRETLAAQPITVTPVDASLDAPASGIAGDTIEVGWTGPDYDGDYITVALPEDRGYINYTYTRDGSPLPLLLPPEPGRYELRYVMAQDRTVIARRDITVEPFEATLQASDTALAGAGLEVGWTGPDYDGDYITVALPEDRGYINYTYTRDGSPLTLLMPPEPGDYEIRYVMAQDRTIAARRAITVAALSASVSGPPTAAAGATVEVTWEGPGYDGDYITVSEPGDNGYVSYTYTREGSPLPLTMPLDPGSYELRYVMAQDRTVLATMAIEVTELGATLDVADSAPAGSLVVVDWDGPGYERDYVAVAVPGSGERDYIDYTYTREGSPLLIRMPIEPGEYEIRYVASGRGESVIARKTVTAGPVTAAISAPDAAPAGSVIALTWEGPDYEGDYIALFKEGEDDYRQYIYTAKDSPMVMTLPEGPGRYELRYVAQQGRTVLATHPIELTYEAQ